MKVKVNRSFTAFVGENSISASEGQTVEMPEGADWIRAGFVEPVEPVEAEAAEKKAAKEAAAEAKKAEAAEKKAPETAAVKPPESAVVAEGKPRGGVMSTEMLKPTKK